MLNPLAQPNQESEEELKAKSARLTQAVASEAQAGLVRWQIESETELQEMERFFLGYVWIIKEGKYTLEEKGKKWCNEKGATGIISIVRPYLSKQFILSNLPEEKVREMMRDISISIIQYLGYWQSDFDIAEGDLPILVKILLHSIEANLRRAVDMRTFDGFTTTYNTKEEFGRKEGGRSGFMNRFQSAFKLTK